jgi:hypothetical protein
VADLGEQRLNVLRRRAVVTLTLLVIQFLLGMGTNLFVMIPTHHSGAGAGPFLSGIVASLLWSFSSGLPVLIAHVVLGIVLLLSAIDLVVHAVRSRRAAAIWLTAGGLVGIVMAAINGASFLKYGLDVNSMLMSAGFAIALLCYVFVLVLRG